MGKDGALKNSIEKYLWIILGLVSGYLLEGIIGGILAVLLTKGYWQISNFLVLESKIMLGIVAIIVALIGNKNKKLKLFCIGVIGYAIIAYLIFKLYILPKLTVYG